MVQFTALLFNLIPLYLPRCGIIEDIFSSNSGMRFVGLKYVALDYMSKQNLAVVNT